MLAYTPPEGFHGSTTFTFTLSDGVATSAPATVTLIVGQEPSSPPPAGCGCAAGSSGGASAAGLLIALLGLLRIRQRTRD